MSCRTFAPRCCRAWCVRGCATAGLRSGRLPLSEGIARPRPRCQPDAPAFPPAGAAAMPPSPLGPYQVDAFNTAKDSENKIHDDAVARRFGFSGGLVPGLEVYAYMTHLPVALWGRPWLEHGTAECRLLKPVYDGDRVTVSAVETADGLDLEVESHGELCATGRASLPAAASPAPAIFAAAPA